MATKLKSSPATPLALPDLADKFVLVTGASAGIGRATVEALLASGAIVFGVDRAVLGYRHKNLHAIRCNLTSARAIAALPRKIATITRQLDGVVNVAGVDPKFALDEGDERKWQSVVDLNLRAYYLVIRACVPFLRRGRGRSIVNISSISYRLGVPRRSIYASTKAGILGLTTGLARELGQENIRINAVSPGWVFTERQVKEYFVGPKARKHFDYLAGVQSLALRISPADVANHILFYLSDVSRASSGHNCVVDAGWLLE